MPLDVANASPGLRTAFAVFPVVLLGVVVLLQFWAARRLGESSATVVRRTLIVAGACAVWLAATGGLAASGRLARFDLRPPPFMAFVVVIVLTAILAARSEWGDYLIEGLPLWALIGIQGFRWPLELLMHRAAAERVMPPQMTYTGWNFDILTGVTAAVLGLVLMRRDLPIAFLRVWNVAGALLLTNIIAVAVVSTPMFGWFGRDALNTWVAHPPFVWLAAVMVPVAIAGHLLIARRLSRERRIAAR